jgi:hypothetical protein
MLFCAKGALIVYRTVFWLVMKQVENVARRTPAHHMLRYGLPLSVKACSLLTTYTQRQDCQLLERFELSWCLQTSRSRLQVPTGASILNSPPQSLEVPADENEDAMSPVAGSNSPLRRILWLLGYNSSEAVNIRAATRLYDAVCAQADTDGLHDTVDMIPVFYSRWYVMLSAAICWS